VSCEKVYHTSILSVSYIHTSLATFLPLVGHNETIPCCERSQPAPANTKAPRNEQQPYTRHHYHTPSTGVSYTTHHKSYPCRSPHAMHQRPLYRTKHQHHCIIQTSCIIYQTHCIIHKTPLHHTPDMAYLIPDFILLAPHHCTDSHGINYSQVRL